MTCAPSLSLTSKLTNDRQEVGSEMPPVLVASRGRGRGHATPDIAIGNLIQTRNPNIQLRYVSYATGADTFRRNAIPVIDMAASEEPEILEMIPKYMRLLLAVKPLLVVAHEEFAIVAAAHDLRIPCIFITDFFMDPNHSLMRLLRQTIEVVFIGESGVFTEPPFLKGRVTYVGRAVRALKYGRGNRGQAREELGRCPEATVGLVQPGGWRESRAPSANLVLKAWSEVERPLKHLYWVTGADHELFINRFGDRPDVTFLKHEPLLERLMVASDIVITKANRMTVYECASLGVPSISLSYSLNWPDEVAIAPVASNTTVNALDTTDSALTHAIVSQMEKVVSPEDHLALGVQGAAERIVDHILRFRMPLELDRMDER
jgi:UDP-N-acetylglucosamine:LPS N-acetylglucosamine transferase